jgi:hypothetical protein
MSTVTWSQYAQTERDHDHRDHGNGWQKHPGEWERIAFHFHQFDHECYGQLCPESDRLYVAWQAALTKTP